MPGKPEKVRYEDAPNLDLVRGMHTRFVVSAEGNDADEVCAGICHHDADMADLVWDATFDEVCYCAKGKLKVTYDDKKGSKGEMVADEGEVLFVPRGYHYIMSTTGVDSINVFATKGRSLPTGDVYPPEFIEALKKFRQRRKR